MKALLLIFLVALCALAQTINVEFDQAANFEKCYTFAMRDGQLNSRNPALNNELVKKRIEADIERSLSSHGFTRVTGPADLSARFHFGAACKAEQETYPAARSLVWRGIAREDKKDSSTLEGKLDDVVRKSIEKYPPKPK